MLVGMIKGEIKTTLWKRSSRTETIAEYLIELSRVLDSPFMLITNYGNYLALIFRNT